jgi:hypothetical protein
VQAFLSELVERIDPSLLKKRVRQDWWKFIRRGILQLSLIFEPSSLAGIGKN